MTTILVIDDEAAILDLVGTVLEDEGFVVRRARNGREGLDMLRLQPVDLVLCDLMMPIMDGCELYHVMLDDEALKKVPFIMMSAVPRDSARLLKCGVTGSISKPFDIKRLTNAVHEALEKGTDSEPQYGDGRSGKEVAP